MSTVTGSQPPLGSIANALMDLTVVHPKALRQRFLLGKGDRMIGRDPDPGGILLADPTVSRSHATVRWDAQRCAHVVCDSGSYNGTRVDTLPVTDTAPALVDQSLLRIGDVLLVYNVSEAPDGESDGDDHEAFPGQAPATKALQIRLARAAKDPAPVLIVGETGTGKERIARQLHKQSGRSGPFVALNCAALSPQLVESQLFGHGKGAFTGATEAQPGLFRAAHEGTLFLDEVGDLPLELQPKLLRALQEGEVLPLGATRPVKVDARVVAATHVNLAAATEEGRFRQDLYARLALWELRVPPLRQRRIDILDWVERLQQVWADERGIDLTYDFDADAAEALLRFAWPLNLRGIGRLVHELGAQSLVSPVPVSALPRWLNLAPAPALAPATAAGARASVPTPEVFATAFHEHRGNVRALARYFDRDRRQIYRWIEAHGLAKKTSR